MLFIYLGLDFIDKLTKEVSQYAYTIVLDYTME